MLKLHKSESSKRVKEKVKKKIRKRKITFR